VLTKDRSTAIVAAGFVVALAVAATLMFTRTGESAPLAWIPGTAVPASLPPGVTVVDDHIPVDVVPDIEAWTGSQLLILGTRGARSVGAVYEPEAGRWRETSPLPFRTALRAPGGVWTGAMWVVVGILCRSNGSACDGAVAAVPYDPGTDTWSPVDENPQPAAGNGRGHDRSFGVGVGMLGSDAAFQIDGQYYTFQVDARTWDWLPQPRSPEPPACSAHGILAAYNADRTMSLLVPGANAWTVAQTVAPVDAAARSIVCTENEVFVYTADLTSVARFDVGARRWSDVPSPPFLVAGPLLGGFTGTSVLFSRPAESVVYGPATRTWRAAPVGLTEDPDRVAWTEFGYALYVNDEDSLVAYNP
jgi:hypothetical protein